MAADLADIQELIGGSWNNFLFPGTDFDPFRLALHQKLFLMLAAGGQNLFKINRPKRNIACALAGRRKF